MIKVDRKQVDGTAGEVVTIRWEEKFPYGTIEVHPGVAQMGEQRLLVLTLAQAQELFSALMRKAS